MNSKFIKASILSYLRFHHRYDLVATECGALNADVVALKDGYLTEVEVKCSMSDLKAEFSKRSKVKTRKHSDKSHPWKPTKFYFAVPRHLAEKAEKYLAGQKTKYGILSVSDLILDNLYGGNVKIVRKAQKLHNRLARPKILEGMQRRLSSELCNLYMKRELEGISNKIIQEHFNETSDEIMTLKAKLALTKGEL